MLGTAVPAVAGSLWGGRAGRAIGQKAWQGVRQAGSDRPGGMDAGAIPHAVSRLEREAFPRASGEAARLSLELHLDEDAASAFGVDRACAAAGSASSQAGE